MLFPLGSDLFALSQSERLLTCPLDFIPVLHHHLVLEEHLTKPPLVTFLSPDPAQTYLPWGHIWLMAVSSASGPVPGA